MFEQFLAENAEFDAARLEAAQSGCIFAEINRVETVAQAAAEAFLNMHCRYVRVVAQRVESRERFCSVPDGIGFVCNKIAFMLDVVCVAVMRCHAMPWCIRFRICCTKYLS